MVRYPKGVHNSGIQRPVLMLKLSKSSLRLCCRLRRRDSCLLSLFPPQGENVVWFAKPCIALRRGRGRIETSIPSSLHPLPPLYTLFSSSSSSSLDRNSLGIFSLSLLGCFSFLHRCLLFLSRAHSTHTRYSRIGALLSLRSVQKAYCPSCSRCRRRRFDRSHSREEERLQRSKHERGGSRRVLKRDEGRTCREKICKWQNAWQSSVGLQRVTC